MVNDEQWFIHGHRGGHHHVGHTGHVVAVEVDVLDLALEVDKDSGGDESVISSSGVLAGTMTVKNRS